ncbi:uncharacterized protein IL334_002693 [Kwoniella shivajii]|uniref:Uncharacterized protein n=1 Tax=Kwoniella shivajii TaxID=564305 RepID=A0ABZ1CVT1_9TREE|nr:hypothetical protein IL334_002693 [Kwoniella shivajii]
MPKANGKRFNPPSHFSRPQKFGDQSAKIIDPSLILPQALLGGEEGIQRLHWCNPDGNPDGAPTEKIALRLWRGWYFDYRTVVERGKKSKMQIIMAFEAAIEDPKLATQHYKRAIQFHDEYVKCELIKTVRFVESALNSIENSKSPEPVVDKLLRKKESGTIMSLEESVSQGEAMKLKGNAAGHIGRHENAIRFYLEALTCIWPWTSTDTSMTFDQASSTGLVKLEQALLGNIASVALSHPAKTGSKRALLDNTVRVICELLLEIRYITLGNLAKSFERLARLDEKEYGDQGKVGVNSFMAELFRDKKGDDWAHRHCVEGHMCHE